MSERTEKEEKLLAKVQKKFPEFTDIVDKEGSVEVLEQKLLIYSKEREKTLHHKANNAELNKAKDEVSALNSLYAPTIDAIKLKSAYIHLLIKDLKEANGEEYN